MFGGRSEETCISQHQSIQAALCFRHPSLLSLYEIILIKAPRCLTTDLLCGGWIHSTRSQFYQLQITSPSIQYVCLSPGCVLLLDF